MINENYSTISNDWNISNPEGYAFWFESRMKLAVTLMEELAIRSKVAKVDDLPVYRWKTPLQQCVQILKRHRDVMFTEFPYDKPISIILTTLAGRAYNGESNIDEALNNILLKMGDLVSYQTPRVPNPVDPSEDFADKWPTTEGKQLNLEKYFWIWLDAAQRDFKIIRSSKDIDFINEQVKEKLSSSLNLSKFSTVSAAAVAAPTIIVKPKTHTIDDNVKPWMKII